MTKKIFAFFLALACAWGAYEFAVQRTFVNTYSSVCDFVAEKIYLSYDKVKDWKQLCLRRSRLVTPYSPKKVILQDLNNTFDMLKVSHLEIFDANEVQDIWQGRSTETGIDGDFVESQFVVFNVQSKSPAEKAGIQKGDIIISLNDQQPSSWTAASETGLYQIQRQDEKFAVEVKQGSFQRDDSPVLHRRENQVAVLRVPSFRSEFFSSEKIKALGESLRSSRMVVVDLRGNAGGNFVAGLRFLSLFICEPKQVGTLVRPHNLANNQVQLPDDLADEHQLEIMGSHRRVVLKTFKSDICVKGRLKVLIDGKSSSVAELVSQALREIRKSPVIGAPSRGQLLVGVWYPMDEVAPGVQISIPEAYYESALGNRIEGQGVQVDRILDYRLPQMQSGIDSWVEDSLVN